jgi:hypothetical protein
MVDPFRANSEESASSELFATVMWQRNTLFRASFSWYPKGEKAAAKVLTCGDAVSVRLLRNVRW